MTDIHKIFKDNSIACDGRVTVTTEEWNDIAKYIEQLHLKIDTLTDDCKLTSKVKDLNSENLTLKRNCKWLRKFYSAHLSMLQHNRELRDNCSGLRKLLKRTLGYQLSDTLKREIVELIGDGDAI